MNNSQKVHFVPVEEIWDEAQEIFKEQKLFLEALIPNADIQHTGGTAVPGSLTKVDIDIQIRVSPEQFGQALEILKQQYIAKHPQLWTNEFAILEDPISRRIPVDYMLTVIDSPYDDFYKVRDFLIANSDVLGEYNELKKQWEGKSYDEYRKAKNKFLGGNGKVRFLMNKS